MKKNISCETQTTLNPFDVIKNLSACFVGLAFPCFLLRISTRMLEFWEAGSMSDVLSDMELANAVPGRSNDFSLRAASILTHLKPLSILLIDLG